MSDHTTTVISRRDLIKLLIGSGVSVAAAAVLSGPLTPLVEQLAAGLERRQAEEEHGRQPRWGMVIDLSKCIGCEYCVYACQATNDTRDDMRWNIHLVDKTATGKTFHITRPCLHCQNAPCVRVCPVARYSLNGTCERPFAIFVMQAKTAVTSSALSALTAIPDADFGRSRNSGMLVSALAF